MIETLQIEKMITHHLNLSLPHHQMRDVYFYAVLPGGKFFRPGLVWSVACDLNESNFDQAKSNFQSNHALLASSVELHHTYTLLHDDLPCMDNDLIRRNKPCTHIAYSEWQALLAGDGLLNISYQLISKMKHPRALELLKLFSWACGPKGLIHGQSLDLSHEMSLSFQNILRTHELKTARLIQVAILGSALLSSESPNRSPNRSLEKKLFSYSKFLGINFQLIDDLSELVDNDLSPHELEVNPWLKFTHETLQTTLELLVKFEDLRVELSMLKETNKVVSDYYKKMINIMEPKIEVISGHLRKEKVDILPVILLMKNFSQT